MKNQSVTAVAPRDWEDAPLINCGAAEEEEHVKTNSSQPLNNQTQRGDTQTQREDIAEDDFGQQFFKTVYDDAAERAASVGPPSKWKTMLVEACGSVWRKAFSLVVFSA